MSYSKAFLAEVSHLMIYEVGGWVNVKNPVFINGTNPKACGYVDDPSDPGGETKYGIAKNDNPDVNIANLNWNMAQAIYYNRYWLPGHCDQLPPSVGSYHMDGCVNNGVGTAAKFLQQAVGITPDGSVGPETIAAVNAQDPITTCNNICNIRLQYYQNIINNNPSETKYLVGWDRRINEMKTFVEIPGNF